MALVDTNLVVRYYMDEAASGVVPETVGDGSGVGDAYDLTISYGAGDSDLEWTEDANGNRGLHSKDTGGNQYARKLIEEDDKVHTALNGSKTYTVEIVADLSSGSTSTGRVFCINSGINTPQCGLALEGTECQVYNNRDLMRSWTRVTGRKVYHIVVDTSQATGDDRVKIYVDGDITSPNVDGTPGQNVGLNVAANNWLYMLNRGDTTWARSIDGKLYYAAIYSGALSAADVKNNADVLLLDDDTPSGGTTYNEVARDTLNLSDRNSITLNALMRHLDGMELSDRVRSILSFSLGQVDGVELGDSTTLSVLAEVVSRDGMTFGDAAVISVQELVQLLGLDGVVLGDSVTLSVEELIQLLAKDGLTLQDLPSMLQTLAGGTIQGVELGDLASLRVSMSPRITDGIRLGDYVSMTVAGVGDLLALDGVSFADAPSLILGVLQRISDGVVFQDRVGIVLSSSANVVDGITFGDVARVAVAGVVLRRWARQLRRRIL